MKKIKKKNIFQRMACILCAGLLALLPFGSFFGIQQQEKIGANAEAFTDEDYLMQLTADSAWLNPYGFFDFSIRRPIDDWTGTFAKEEINCYTFAMPKYVTDPAFFRENGVVSVNSVFNYLPLYTGSIHMTLNDSTNNKNWRFFSQNIPNPLEDYFNSSLSLPYCTVFSMSAHDVLIPALFFDFYLNRNLCFMDMPATEVWFEVDFLALPDENTQPPKYRTFSYSGFVSPNLDAGVGFMWHIADIMKSCGLNSVDEFVFSNDCVYIKNLRFDFLFETDIDISSAVSTVSPYFSFGMPSVIDDMVTKGEYQEMSSKFADIIQRTTFVVASPTDSIFAIVENFLNVELFPGFRIYYMLYVSVAGLVIGFAIKIFLQG